MGATGLTGGSSYQVCAGEGGRFRPDFSDFKGLLHNARLRKYKGRSVDDSDITEIFEYTARQHVDYANETSFQQMIEDLEDESLSLVFTYDGNDYTIRVGLLTGSVYFQSYTPEEAVEYVFDAYKTTFWEDR